MSVENTVRQSSRELAGEIWLCVLIGFFGTMEICIWAKDELNAGIVVEYKYQVNGIATT